MSTRTPHTIPSLPVDPQGSTDAVDEHGPARATQVLFFGAYFTVLIDDGRRIDVPLKWYPRLFVATYAQQTNYELAMGGESIYWPEVDEDIRVASLLEGRRSNESKAHLRLWYQREQRAKWEAVLQQARTEARRSVFDKILDRAADVIAPLAKAVATKLELRSSKKERL